MNILTDELPNSVEIVEKRYIINTDYRVGIRFEQLMLNNEVSADEKLLQAKRLYFGDNPPPLIHDEETTNKLIWFYLCGKDGNSKISTENERVYDFEYDSKWIFAAFREQYNIQLDSTIKMHWWTFKALFDALSEETEFVKIMGYRAIKINGKMSTTQKRFYQKMKKLHKLPMPKADEKRINNIEVALMNRQSLEKVL